jgi:hypothetical protein
MDETIRANEGGSVDARASRDIFGAIVGGREP